MRFNKPRSFLHHLVYWPFLLLAGYFGYIAIYAVFRLGSNEAAYSLEMALTDIVLSITMAAVFVAFALFSVRPPKKPKHAEKIKDFGLLSGIKFVFSATELKLGEPFQVKLTGACTELFGKEVFLFLCCVEITTTAAGGDSGYETWNYRYEGEHALDHKALAGADINLCIPTHCSPTLSGIDDAGGHWFVRVGFKGRDRKYSAEKDGIDSSELTILPILMKDAQYRIPAPFLENNGSDECWIELAAANREDASSLRVEVGGGIRGKLIVSPLKSSRKKNLNLELSYYLYAETFVNVMSIKVGVPALNAGERFSYPFELEIPKQGPISVQAGQSGFATCWCIRARSWSDRLFALESVSTSFVVVPTGVLNAESRQNADSADLAGGHTDGRSEGELNGVKI